jgi:hypothetical protein
MTVITYAEQHTGIYSWKQEYRRSRMDNGEIRGSGLLAQVSLTIKGSSAMLRALLISTVILR